MYVFNCDKILKTMLLEIVKSKVTINYAETMTTISCDFLNTENILCLPVRVRRWRSVIIRIRSYTGETSIRDPQILRLGGEDLLSLGSGPLLGKHLSEIHRYSGLESTID